MTKKHLSSEPTITTFQSPFRLPSGATQVILVRHGASTAAQVDVPVALVGGHADHPLSEAGHVQAELVADRLVDDEPVALFVTSLRRTAETAVPLQERLGIAPVVLEDLREVQIGDWEAGNEFARRMAAGDPLLREAFMRERWDVLPGGEPSNALAARVTQGIRRVVETARAGASAVVFTHGGIIAEACHQATGSRPFAFLASENASITRVLVHPDGGWSLRAYNDTSHLR